MLEAAAEQFGGKSEEDIKEICLVSIKIIGDRGKNNDPSIKLNLLAVSSR